MSYSREEQAAEARFLAKQAKPKRLAEDYERELAALRKRCEDLISTGSRMVQYVPNRDYSMLVRDWDALTAALRGKETK